MTLVAVDAFVPELSDLDAWQGKGRWKDSQAESLSEAFGKLRRKGPDGVSTACYKCAGHEAGHANMHSVGLKLRIEHLIEQAMRRVSGIRGCHDDVTLTQKGIGPSQLSKPRMPVSDHAHIRVSIEPLTPHVGGRPWERAECEVRLSSFEPYLQVARIERHGFEPQTATLPFQTADKRRQ